MKYLSFALFSVLFPTVLYGEDRSFPKDGLLSISNAYTANVSSFVHGEVKFTFSQSTKSGAANAVGYCVYDHSKCLYSLLFSEADLLADAKPAPGKSASDRGIVSTLLSYRFLTDGKDTLNDRIYADPLIGKVRHVAQIVPAGDELEKDVMLPLDIQSFQSAPISMLKDIAALVEGRSNVKFIRFEKRPDSQLLVLELTVDDVRHTYWIDQERGAIPTLIRYESPKMATFEIANEQLTFVPDVGWLPFLVEYRLPNSKIKKLIVHEASFASTPADSLYSLSFGEPVTILHSRLKIKAQNRLSAGLRDLSSLSGPGSARINIVGGTPVTPPEFPTHTQSTNYPLYIGIVVSVVTVSVFAFKRKCGGNG